MNTEKKSLLSRDLAKNNLNSQTLSPTDLAPYIEHTLLKPDAQPVDIIRLCEEALQFHFLGICVNSAYIRSAARILRGSAVKPVATVGFPLGACTSATKAFETREAIQGGAVEVDMVIALGALKSQDYAFVFQDIRAVVQAAEEVPVKVIIEAGALNEDQKIVACSLAKAAGATFVKTSTGFGYGGATAEDVRLMRQTVGSQMGVKASGGIRKYEDAIKMIEAGATRLGTSAGITLVSGPVLA